MLHYRSEIDGLRAVAVLPVILFHAGFEPFSGGYVGVDIFFVISGYLITSILIEDLRHDSFSIVRFYERRARRLLPALFLVLACTSAAAWIWMVPEQLHEYSRTLVQVIAFVSNIYFWHNSDYFAAREELNPLIHTWSLAVEEQFYIVFPIALFLFWRLARQRLLLTLALLTAASLLLAEWGWRTHPDAAFFLLPTRAWELGIGAICAAVLSRAPVPGIPLLAGAGLGLILLAAFTFDAATPVPSLLTLAPAGGAALVILFAAQGGLVARFLSLRPIVLVGLVSSSGYVWPQPLFAVVRLLSLNSRPSTAPMLGLALVNLVLAYLTWRFVERPFRRGAGPLLGSRAAIFAGSALAAAAFLGVGLHGERSQGRLQAWLATNPDRAQVYRLYADARRENGVYRDDGACQFNVAAIDAATAGRLRACYAANGPGIAILGDSHAMDLFEGMTARGGQSFLFGLTYGNCWLDAVARDCDYDGLEALLREEPKLFSRVFYHQAGFRFFHPAKKLTGREYLQQLPLFEEVRAAELGVLQQPIDHGIHALVGLSALTDLVWIGPRIEPQIGLNVLLQGGCDHTYQLRRGQRQAYEDLDRRLAEIAAGAGLDYRSLLRMLPFDMETDFITCDRLYWRDGDHWSPEGAARFVGRILRDLSEPRVEVRR